MSRIDATSASTRFSEPRPTAPSGGHKHGPRVLARAIGVGLLAISSVAQELPTFGEDEDRDPRAFSIYATEGALSLANGVRKHLAAGRDLDALVELQRLIEDHSSEVLNAERPRVDGRASEGDVHYGAANWARQQLFGFPTYLQDQYRERYAQKASAALAGAKERGDRRALTRLAGRWPITLEAEQAWLALGDLELELGNADDARLAWKRALSVALLDLDLEMDAALREELDQRFERAGVEGERARAHSARLDLAGRLSSNPSFDPSSPWANALEGHEAPVDPPHSDADSWDPFELDFEHPFRGPRSRTPVLYPTRWKDLMLFTTSLELLAVGAYTGELVWTSGRVPGWDRLSDRERDTFQEAIQKDDALVRPAVGQGVAVAALQIPVSFDKNLNYGDMKIIVKIPNRRLFAFDAESGEPLWDTRPPAGWDGVSGDFAERMRVVGSPTISGSRVLVPCVRLQGRIEYHVGCFDLFTGELLWSTPIITGQRERNMFGRSVGEYVAPPVVVAGDRVLAQTQLGTLASLDLFTGEMQWEVLYEKIQLRATHSFSAPRRLQYWRSAPPAVAGNTVVATPDDSKYLIGVDLESGCLLWSQRIEYVQSLFGTQVNLEYLLGADEYTVFLGGSHVAALEFPLGIHRFGNNPTEVPQIQWKWPTGKETLTVRSPRPVLTSEHVFVPRPLGVAVLGRKTGALNDNIPALSGNLLVADGELFALRADQLSGRFDWDRLVERAREELVDDPSNEAAAMTLAELLEKRGRSSASRARLKESAAQLTEARLVLESLAGGDDVEAHPRIQARLHSVLRAQAETQRYLGESQAAVRSLERARALAPTVEDLRDTLLEELDLTPRSDLEAWVDCTRRLERECGDLDLEVFAFEPMTADGLTRLVPVLTYDEQPEEQSYPVPVGLWALLARLERGTDGATEFEDLHSLLELYADLRLNGESLGTWATDRIEERLTTGQREGYEPFEVAARELLDEATERGDTRLLAKVGELFPFSRAAGEANEVRLDLALRSGDAASVAEIVLAELPTGWKWERATNAELQLLAQLAFACGQSEDPAGRNLELRAALGERLAAVAPSFTPELPAAVQSLIDWRDSWVLPEPPAPASTRAEFAEDVSSGRGLTLRGRYRPLGEVPPAVTGTNAGDLLLFAKDERLQAVASQPRVEPTWSLVLSEEDIPDSWTRSLTTTPGRVHLATPREVRSLGRDDGQPLWKWSRPELRPIGLASDQGVVVVQNSHVEDEDSRVIVALDAALGYELWRLRIADTAFADEWLVEEGYVVLLPSFVHEEGVVIDLFTGSRMATFEASLSRGSAAESWIQAGQLVIPRFVQRDPEDNYLSAIELATGRTAWSISLEDVHQGCQLLRIVSYDGEVYLAVQPKGRSKDRPGALYGLDVERGLIDATPIADFSTSDRWIGINQRNHVRLPSPWVFLLTDRIGDGSQNLRAVHLPYGRRWDTSLRLHEDDLYVPGAMQLPALSRSTAVVAWRELRQGARRTTETVVAFFDRASGDLLDTRNLPPSMNGSAPLILRPLGDALILCGADQMEIWK